MRPPAPAASAGPAACAGTAACAASPGPLGPGATPNARLDPTPVRFVQRIGEAVLHWSVVEVDASAVPGAHGARCLIFPRAERIRRVWVYPPDWRALDAAGLAALSWQR